MEFSSGRHGIDMKRITTSIVLITIVLLAFAPAAHAQEFHRNAYGMYAAPTMFGLAEGTKYELATSGGGLDLGIYYARAFNPRFSIRLEAKYAVRDIDEAGSNGQLFGGEYFPFRLHESMVEIPLVVESDRRIPVSNHELRVSVGGGASYKYVLDQQLLVPSGELNSQSSLTPADSYQKFAILLDGGTTFEVDRKSAVFLRLRFDWDVATFGEPADASIIRRFWATGFYAGFEYGL
jgi:hypothetical protein